jgi:hypothetical protein
MESKHWEPIPHWTNFTLSELKQILGHCQALEDLGIAQDQEMMRSIQRDISLRTQKENKTAAHLTTKMPEYALLQH